MRTVTVCGVAIPIRVGTIRDCPDLKDSYGCFDRDSMTIWICDTCPSAALDLWTAHEVLHAIILLSGMRDMTQAIFALTESDPRLDAWEEATIRVMAPPLVAAFKDLRGRSDHPQRQDEHPGELG